MWQEAMCKLLHVFQGALHIRQKMRDRNNLYRKKLTTKYTKITKVGGLGIDSRAKGDIF